MYEMTGDTSYSYSTYSAEYTVTIDSDGNYIYPEGYEAMDPNDPSTWPGYDDDMDYSSAQLIPAEI